MYKIFVNEKPLTINDKESEAAYNLPYESKNTFEIAFDMLLNTQKSSVNIYYFDKDVIWEEFQKYAVPVYAAGGVVQNSQDKYLFIKRNGKWDLPKGHVEKGETLEAAAIREVEEECSVTNLVLGEFIAPTYHVYYDKYYCLKVVYWYGMKCPDVNNPVPQTEENIEIAAWFKKEEISELMKNTYKNIEELVFQYILK